MNDTTKTIDTRANYQQASLSTVAASATHTSVHIPATRVATASTRAGVIQMRYAPRQAQQSRDESTTS